MEFTALEAFRGTLNDSSYVHPGTLKQLYKTLLFSRVTTSTYMLFDEESGNHFGQYRINGGLLYSGTTSEARPGKLYIDFLDEEKGIISGRFEFTLFDEDGNEIKITDGRFDMNYTN